METGKTVKRKPLSKATRERIAAAQRARWAKFKKEAVAKQPDTEWVSTERSDAAEEALAREYAYHMLRATELKNLLHGVGMEVGNW